MSLRLVSLVAVVALTGCLGSPEPYSPYREGTREPRPDPAEREADERALRLETEIPAEIARAEAEREMGRRTLRRIRSEIPRNPWVDYERDMVNTLSMEHAAPYLAYAPADRLATNLRGGPEPVTGPKPAAEGEEDAEDEGEEE